MSDQWLYGEMHGLQPLPVDSAAPSACGFLIDWERVRRGPLGAYIPSMDETPQNPEWHGEGSVWAHTKMVCEGLIREKAWLDLDRRRQEAVLLAALLHDAGKPLCTRWENGVPVSPYHAPVGARIARELLWQECGLAGSAQALDFRETICSLIRYHSVPFHFFDVQDPERAAIRTAAHGSLVRDFSLELLALLVEADMKGRVAPDTEERLEHLAYFREIAREAACWTSPLAFPSAFSRYAYLSGRDVVPGQDLYNDTWGTVVVLAGLPGTGKDTYVQKAYEGWPMVSLDTLRREMGILPEETQGKVVAAAYEQAKTYLRRKQPFVWNATNVTPLLRRGLVDTITGYGAAAKIIYLETGWETVLARNKARSRVVPEEVILKLLKKLVLPDVCEAHEVEWVVV